MSDPIRLTAAMMDSRDTMRRFWGDRYAAKVQPYREAIRKQRKSGEPVLSSALRVIKRLEEFGDTTGNPMVIILGIAAAVDECEVRESE